MIFDEICESGVKQANNDGCENIGKDQRCFTNRRLPFLDFIDGTDPENELITDAVRIRVLTRVLYRTSIDIYTQGLFRAKFERGDGENARATANIDYSKFVIRFSNIVDRFLHQFQTQLCRGMRSCTKRHTRIDLDRNTIRIGRIHPRWNNNKLLTDEN